MNNSFFKGLIAKSKELTNISKSFIFANITYSLDGQISTGTYEFFGEYESLDDRRKDIEKIVAKSFTEIHTGKCFSLYKHLTNNKIRYGRIIVDPSVDFNECRFSDSSTTMDINTFTITSPRSDNPSRIIKSEKEAEDIPKQGSAGLLTILNYYSKYCEAIKGKNSIDKQTLYFYLVRPLIDNNRIDGMLYFASKEIVAFEHLSQISYYLTNLLTDRVFERIDKESIKSAMAAIMARNMSHNLGSHFLTNTKNYFSQQIRQLEKAKKNSQYHIDIDPVAKDFRGNVAVLQYLQERMDFIATVISGDKYPYGSLNFKSQLFDILTEDDHGERHGKESQNFLLKYLVYSEKLTRGSNSELTNGFHEVKLIVEYIDEKNKIIKYTGKALNQGSEENAKLTLSKLSLAVPGGLMARHALFSIIENIIRNSAKHSKKDSDLTITIRLSQSDSNLNIKIFDNREDKKAITAIENHFKKLRIVNTHNNTINKESKGLKEILTCILWLKNEDVSDILSKIQEIDQGNDSSDERLKVIESYLEIGEENGNLCYSFSLPLFAPYLLLEPEKHYIIEDNKIKFINNNKILKEYHADIVAASNDYELLGDRNEEVGNSNRKLSDIFPRFIISNVVGDETQMLKLIHPEYFLKKISINDTRFIDKSVTDGDKVVVSYANKKEDDWDILFYDHFHTKSLMEKLQILSDANGRYIESISGENFTSTIATEEFLKDSVARYKTVEAALSNIIIIDERIFADFKQRQKDICQKFTIKIDPPQWWDESADFKSLWKQLYYNHWTSVPKVNQNEVEKIAKSTELADHIKIEEIKKIIFPSEHIQTEYGSLSDDLKAKASRIEQSILEARKIYLFDFNEQYNGFVDLNNSPHNNKEKDKDSSQKDKNNHETFLSIHLGMIEKFKDYYKKKNLDNFRQRYSNNNDNEKEEIIDKELTREALIQCMKLLKEQFKPQFISIHSGRGNYSADLSDGLKDYPFMSLSALEAALYNSKYFLSELFHNTNYYGKGNLNNEQTV